ncbi:MAG: MBL fold metallo-hydrolase [Anaerolineae bacterium]|nr:MBL fold metallo-hydrolase [Anaerolineae bacterium]
MDPIRIELPTGWSMGSVNAYLFTHPEIILVDTGDKAEDAWEALVDGLAAHGVAPRDISRVVITHPHVDHFGSARRIIDESDATVWIFEQGAPWLLESSTLWEQRANYYRDHFLPRTGLPAETRQLIVAGNEQLRSMAVSVPEERIIPFRAGGELHMGGMGWQIIHTPGHASTQTVFYQPETRQLISADMLLAVVPVPIVEHPPAGRRDRDPALPQFMRSLAALEALEVDRVYPGHGRPFDDHRAVITRQRERIESRKAQCLELIREGKSTIPELLEIMYSHQPPVGRVTGLWMLVGYLDLLIDDGLVREEELDGVSRYYPVPDRP